MEFNLASVTSSSASGSAGGESPVAASGGTDSASSTAKRDFHNPMFDAMRNLESEASSIAAASSGGGSGSTTLDNRAPPPLTVEEVANFSEPPSAVIAPSSVTHKGSPKMKRKELAPAALDTGKDTQCLVTEDDSEC